MRAPTRYTQTPRRDRINWLSAFEAHAIAAKPELAGRIEWDSAIFFFNSGASAIDAAARYVASREV